MANEISAGLYIHIPFCQSLCLYCDFYSKVGSAAEIERFLPAAGKEAEINGAQYPDYRYNTVFLGGGTPSILESNQIEKLFESLRRALIISDNAEITIECNPSSLSRELLNAYKSIGITRVSLGVQSFNDMHLKRLGRAHSSSEAVAAFELARRGGFDNISIDLIYGLPDQTIAEWSEDIEQAVKLCSEHISAYNLIIEEETHFGKLHRQGGLNLPPDYVQESMYTELNEMLGKAGYGRYEISNFARSGYECRHNLKYWRLEPYIGLGPAAVSSDLAARWKNKPDLDSYITSLEAGQRPTREIEELTGQKVREEYIMLSLRLSEGLSLNELLNRFGYDLRYAKVGILDTFESNGYLEINGDMIRLTEKALFISDEIIVRLI